MADRNQVLEQLFEKVPLREGVERKQAFELIMITAKHFEDKFLAEVTDMSAIDDAYAQNLFEQMNAYYGMIRHGIAH